MPILKHAILLAITILFLKNVLVKENNQSAHKIQFNLDEGFDRDSGAIHPFVKQIFYNLSLEKCRKDLRNEILSDERFTSTDTSFNDYETASFFKGITFDKGLIIPTPDSVQMMLVLGNTSLSTEKGAEADFKNVMLLNCRYFFSNKETVEQEYERFVNVLSRIIKNSSSGKSITPYSAGKVGGQMKIIEHIFENYRPYYRVGISSIHMTPEDNSKSTFILDLVFGKEDK